MTNVTPSPFVYRRPRWGRGTITDDDAHFLHNLVLELQPSVVVELGVASGCSSVVLLEALAQVSQNISSEGIWLHSFDVMDHCYFDPSRPVGAAVAQLAPHLLAHWRLTIGDALQARQQLAGIDVPMAFIDANHLHPWATADLLALLPVLARGAWVALHDIRLPLLHLPKSNGHGPMHLFGHWPGEKRSGGTNDNIGAIRLPSNNRDVITILHEVLQNAWEAELPAATLATLGIRARPVLPPRVLEQRHRGIRDLKRAVAASRPIYIWGTGQAGRGLLAYLRKRGLSVRAFLDRDPAKQGLVVDGVKVLSPTDVTPSAVPCPFIAFSGTFAAEIAEELAAAGWLRRDYLEM
jgi:cephalosporin hydroxylase